MKKALVFFGLILTTISGCNYVPPQIDFSLGSYANEIIEIDDSTLMAKLTVSNDSFFLAAHKGNSCTCWNDFMSVIQEYNQNRKDSGKEYLPFFSIDLEKYYKESFKDYKIDNIVSGYVDFYVVVNGQVKKKYSKNAKLDYEMFENVSKFSSVVDGYIKAEPIKNYSYISYNYLTNNIINKDNNEFALVIVRSGCTDCKYVLPNVIEPFIKQNELKIPLLVVDIEEFRNNEEQYKEIKTSLRMTQSSSPYGYLDGYVPMYQYWKNGNLEDAGVYANDFFDYNDGNPILKSTYFDGRRNLKYTDKLLIVDLANPPFTLSTYFDSKTNMTIAYANIKEEAILHDPLLISFLTYYCKK